MLLMLGRQGFAARLARIGLLARDVGGSVQLAVHGLLRLQRAESGSDTRSVLGKTHTQPLLALLAQQRLERLTHSRLEVGQELGYTAAGSACNRLVV